MQESIVFLVCVQCRRKESSRSLSHLLMSFLFKFGTKNDHLVLFSPDVYLGSVVGKRVRPMDFILVIFFAMSIRLRRYRIVDLELPFQSLSLSSNTSCKYDTKSQG